MQTYRLAVRSVVDQKFALTAKVAAVKDIFGRWGFDYEITVDYLWYGWPSKLAGFIEIANTLPKEYTHLMFVDAADVVVLGPPEQVMERWLRFNRPWVYNAEPFIWSPGSFQPEDYPTPDVKYRYLNAGASIGEVAHIRQCFDKWTDGGKTPPLCVKGDQDWMAARYLKDYPDAITLDTGCELFQCMCGSQAGDDETKHLVEVTPGCVYNRVTGTKPLVIHFNGGTDISMPERTGLWKPYLA